MQDKFTFKYAIIRIVPKVEREEFFNVGVIVFCKRTKFLDIKFNINETKLKAFSCKIELSLLNDYLKAWKMVCEGNSASQKIGQLDLSDRFGWLTANRSTIIQSSQIHSGVTDNPKEALKDIFENYIL